MALITLADAPFPWQQDAWRRLRQREAMGRLPHAVLCVGAAGLGKDLFARRFAQRLFCAAPSSVDLPCGICRGCRLFLADTHPDYLRIEPEAAGKPIKVEPIRELRDFLAHTSQFGGYKIAALSMAERMNVNAANSLLKTLEEPPPRSLLLLVSAAPARLPATVRSRCQRLVFAAPSASEARDWLIGRVAADVDPALLLSLGGAPLRALESADRLPRRRELFENYRQILGDVLDPVQAAAAWKAGELGEALGWLVGWHMDMIHLKMVEGAPRLINPDLRADLQALARRLPARTLFQRLDAATRLLGLAATPVNMPLMLEAFFAESVEGQA